MFKFATGFVSGIAIWTAFCYAVIRYTMPETFAVDTIKSLYND